jgi:hypothetical protein
MNKAEFMSNLNSARAEWDALVAQAQAQGDATMVVSSEAADGWSVKDLIAHAAWYEREILRLLTTRDLSYEPADELWAMRNSDRNQVIYDIHRDWSLGDVLADEQKVYKELFVELRKLKEEDFTDPRRFKGMPMDWIPWRVMAENTYEHYISHLEDITRLIEANRSPQQASL